MRLLPGRVSRVALKAGVVMETLESRRLFSLTVQDGIITILGTDGADQVYIRGSHSRIPTSQGTVVAEQLLILEPGSDVFQVFDSTRIAGIRVEGGGGDDHLSVYDPEHDLCFPVTLLGGAGNDSLTGHQGSDVLDGGGGGADVIHTNPFGQIGQPTPEPALDDSIMRDGAGMPFAMARLLDDGTLRIATLGGSNMITFGTAGADGGQMYVYISGQTRTFDAADVRAVVAGGGAGRRMIRVQNRADALVEVPMTMIGGDGNDTLLAQTDRDWHGKRIALRGHGPFAPAVLIGGDGDDVLVAGIGDTTMLGGSGDDHYTRGWGDDTIVDEDSPIPPVAPEPPEPPVIPTPDDNDGEQTDQADDDGSDDPQPSGEGAEGMAVPPRESAVVTFGLDAESLNRLVFGRTVDDVWQAPDELAA